MNRLLSLFVAVVMSLAGSAAMAGQHASAKDAETMLASAVEKLKHDGPDQAFAAFNDQNGSFLAKELYVFVFDINGKYRASGFNPKLTGRDAYDLRDADGKYLVREMIDIAKTTGAGTVNYVWYNPDDQKVERKHSLIRRVGDFIVGVGYYED